jgi:TRAP-type C4-dicarboxylate transport system substrate-binding protein
MNRDSFDQLDPQNQEKVKEAARTAEAYGWEQVTTRTARNYSDMRAHGMNIAEEVPSELVESLATAGQAAVDLWKSDAGTRGTELLETYMPTSDAK